MTAAIARIKDHFTRWREWELNAVVVKELRQAVRSWTVTGMLLLFLAVLFCGTLAFLIGQSFGTNEDQFLGARLFQGFLVMLTVASFAFIPLYVGIRLAVERQESNLDLLYVTTLTPKQIIRGKFLCGAYMAVLFFSACMPFMVFTNLLRGIDLPTIFFILTCLFLAVCAAIQVAIFLACLPISKLLKILLGLFATGCALSLIGPLIFMFFEMTRAGIGSMMGARDFWIPFFSVVGIILAIGLLLYYFSVAMISPPSANRALPLRAYITVIWVLGAVLCFFWARKEHEIRYMLPWGIITILLMTAALVVIVSNQDRLSLRVRRDIPRNPVRRALAFFFYNGAAGGLAWAALLMGITLIVLSRALHFDPGSYSRFGPLPPEDVRELEFTWGTFSLYAFAYALLALLLHRRLMPRRSPKLAGVLTLLLPSAWALLPYIVFFFANHLNWNSIENSQLGNIFNVFVVKNDSQRQAHLVFAAIWLLVMMLLNAKWFVQQVKSFQPLQRQSEPPIISEVSPPISTVVK